MKNCILNIVFNTVVELESQFILELFTEFLGTEEMTNILGHWNIVSKSLNSEISPIQGDFLNVITLVLQSDIMAEEEDLLGSLEEFKPESIEILRKICETNKAYFTLNTLYYKII